ncbi:MAG TPA: glyoxalase/bleomycin resistance/extradiol dioxygenase family protein, partial [Lachnoclostridium phytofermentans]|nr:glyoxalase/bleomycin resistance/extradiol dioxygenase family protein [Lachnoclostridium phytofermentans]
MISTLGQVMVYVNNQDESVKFWTEKVGFTVISEEDNGEGMRWIEIAPQKDSQTSIVLHNKEVIAKMGSGANLEAPS